MKKLRKRFDTFCYQNRHKGIHNLMLYIALTSGVIYFITLITQNTVFIHALQFDRDLILQGQVWRLFTGVFTEAFSSGGPLLVILSLYVTYILGRALELCWGALRFNLYYLSGILFMDIFAMAFGGIPVVTDKYIYDMSGLYATMANYLHLTLLIAYATAYPDSQFLIFFIFPVKAWILGVAYFAIVLLDVAMLSYPTLYFPHNLFPLVAFGNYFLFVGRDIRNIIPGLRDRPSRPKHIYVKVNTEKKEKAAYTHKCVLCGRTDVSNPELEFRYCSRCNGYFCYCQDHISNHTHVE